MHTTQNKMSPFDVFSQWINEAKNLGLPEHNAMSLATTSQDGWPSARTVLLKQFDLTGLYFYTNYESQKARELSQNPRVTLLFFWPQLGKQIRIVGVAEQTSRSESEAYFSTRDRLSQIGAWASKQSSVLSSTEDFMNEVNRYERVYADCKVPCPPHWGGFCVRPRSFEFWQAKSGRLHERMIYQERDGQWTTSLLFP